jgi:hypothetical protein
MRGALEQEPFLSLRSEGKDRVSNYEAEAGEKTFLRSVSSSPFAAIGSKISVSP